MPEEVTLKVNGKDVTSDVGFDLLSVVVDTSINLPSMFSVEMNVRLDLETAKVVWIDDKDKFVLGQEIEIGIETDELPDEPSPVKRSFKGEISALEPRFNEGGGASVVIRGYDKSHRLTRGKKTTTYLQQKDSDIAVTLAGNGGLTGQADDTRMVHDYVLQDNASDWDFLVSRARRNGFCVQCVDDTLYFAKEPSGEDKPSLVWGENLRRFDCRVSTGGQVSAVMVQGWDPKQQQMIVGRAEAPSQTDQPKPGGQEKGTDATWEAFGDAEEIIVDRPVADQEEAQAIAQGILDENARGFIEADCQSLGDPRIRAGVLVSLENLGERFSGTYRVTRAIHRYSRGSLSTEFTVGSRHATTISRLLGARRNGGSMQTPVLGLVTNLDDPDELGRVKVKIPTLGDQTESWWARLVVPGGGAERGLQWSPEVNDEVLVVFEYGDVNRPLVIGGLWSSPNRPPAPTSETISGGKVNQRIIKTRVGHTIILDDTDGSEQIIIRDKTESNEFVIDSAKNTITLKADADINIEAKGNMTLKSTGDMNLECQNLSVKAKTNGTVEAMANLDLKATGMLNAKGSKATVESDGMTEVKSSAMVKVQGNPIMLN